MKRPETPRAAVWAGIRRQRASGAFLPRQTRPRPPRSIPC